MYTRVPSRSALGWSLSLPQVNFPQVNATASGLTQGAQQYSVQVQVQATAQANQLKSQAVTQANQITAPLQNQAATWAGQLNAGASNLWSQASQYTASANSYIQDVKSYVATGTQLVSTVQQDIDALRNGNAVQLTSAALKTAQQAGVDTSQYGGYVGAAAQVLDFSSSLAGGRSRAESELIASLRVQSPALAVRAEIQMRGNKFDATAQKAAAAAGAVAGAACAAYPVTAVFAPLCALAVAGSVSEFAQIVKGFNIGDRRRGLKATISYAQATQSEANQTLESVIAYLIGAYAKINPGAQVPTRDEVAQMLQAAGADLVADVPTGDNFWSLCQRGQLANSSLRVPFFQALLYDAPNPTLRRQVSCTYNESITDNEANDRIGPLEAALNAWYPKLKFAMDQALASIQNVAMAAAELKRVQASERAAQVQQQTAITQTLESNLRSAYAAEASREQVLVTAAQGDISRLYRVARWGLGAAAIAASAALAVTAVRGIR
jgi:hypothetical protein